MKGRYENLRGKYETTKGKTWNTSKTRNEIIAAKRRKRRKKIKILLCILRIFAAKRKGFRGQVRGGIGKAGK